MKKIILFVLAGTILTAMGCGTVKGFGEDLKTVGNWFTRGSDKATDKAQ